MVQGTVSSAGLPPPWQEVHAEGLTYYWNTQTNETTYARPVAGAAPSKPGVDYSYLSAGANFEKHGNPDGYEHSAPSPPLPFSPLSAAPADASPVLRSRPSR